LAGYLGFMPIYLVKPRTPAGVLAPRRFGPVRFEAGGGILFRGVAVATHRPGKIGSSGLLIALVLAIGICVVISMREPKPGAAEGQPSGPPPPPTKPAFHTELGSFAKLGAEGMKTVWLCLDEASWNDMIDAQNLASKGGQGAGGPLYRLASAKKIRVFPAGTRVRVTKTGVTSRRVEVLEGDEIGTDGWIQTELLREDR
jgi:hypothetical protein